MRREWLPLISIIFLCALATQVAAEDTEAPTITVNSPADTATVYIGAVVFRYTPSDNQDVYRCNLYVNETKARTSSEIVKSSENAFNHSLLSGIYSWNIECLDSANNKGQSSNRTLTVKNDADAPNVSIEIFQNAQRTSTVQFNYTAKDNASGIDKCELIIDDESVATSTSVSESETNRFSYTPDEGTWSWKVKCTDKSGNSKESDSAQVIFAKPMAVELVSPGDNQETAESALIFKYKPVSPKEVTKCTLFLNDIANQSALNIAENDTNEFQIKQVPMQEIYWKVECTDRDETATNSSERQLKVTTKELLESSPPKVMLVHPVATSIVNGSIFSYKVSSDLLNITLCELYLDDLWNATDAEVESGVQQEFEFINTDKLGNHSWYVKCLDERGQSAYSENASFIVVESLPAPVADILQKVVEKKQENKTEITAPPKTMSDTLGETTGERVIKLVLFIFLPLAIVISILRSELSGACQYRSTHHYSRRRD